MHPISEQDPWIGHMLGPFQVLRRIDSDEWGALYDAVQSAVNRPVALKILHRDLHADPEKIRQFVAIAATMAHAQNPYLTAVYECGQSGGWYYYAREQPAGANLQERTSEGRPLSEDQALLAIIHVGEALNYEKNSNIPHLPLVMSQIYVPDDGDPKLLNNVVSGSEEVSAGEVDEIRRLGLIIREALMGAETSSETQTILQCMERAGDEGGIHDWDTLLREVRHLDLSRRAMRVTRTISSAKLPTLTNVDIPRMPKWVPWVSCAAAAALGLLAWKFFGAEKKPGATDVDSMVKISAGPFVYGDPGQTVTLPTFYMDKYEVTIGQYEKFLKAWKQNKASLTEHPKVDWKIDHTPANWEQVLTCIQTGSKFYGQRLYDNSPVFNVDYFDAWAYAHWAGKRLPTEQEWEKAARGPQGNLYPWGNTPDAKKANTGADYGYGAEDPNFGSIDGYGSWAPVGAMKQDRSYYGVMDMAGNVSEWTDSWDAHKNFPDEQVPVIRGGNWSATDDKLTNRDHSQPPRQKKPQIGFRCAADQIPPPKK